MGGTGRLFFQVGSLFFFLSLSGYADVTVPDRLMDRASRAFADAGFPSEEEIQGDVFWAGHCVHREEPDRLLSSYLLFLTRRIGGDPLVPSPETESENVVMPFANRKPGRPGDLYLHASETFRKAQLAQARATRLNLYSALTSWPIVGPEEMRSLLDERGADGKRHRADFRLRTQRRPGQTPVYWVRGVCSEDFCSPSYLKGETFIYCWAWENFSPL